MQIARKHIFKKLSGGRVFALPDVHGELNLLNELLGKVNFDEENDKLITLGDTINRGPHSFETLDKLSKIKNSIHFLGNHEISLIRAFEKHWFSYDSPGIDTGKNEVWQNEVPIAKLKETIDRYIEKSAYCGTIQVNNTTFGISHGDATLEHWSPEILSGLGKEKLKAMICNRARYKNTNGNQYQGIIRGVDWTIHGHTINENITMFKNSIFLDVGAGSTTRAKKLAILDLNEFSKSKCIETSSTLVQE
ncbi:metallophosphoesterase [Pseudoalteromonas marina]|uniref:Metallophosphoesterase n=1 Tax=Pseudoalteromonas marina TaxID=267375 RepID=A0ABT9FGD5_9GAMM|nr:metallophosphoesterase [Pseudoalteromonas marina]MDP2565839.1 metallophosphoesterase [Pseudoalteromonas marina]